MNPLKRLYRLVNRETGEEIEMSPPAPPLIQNEMNDAERMARIVLPEPLDTTTIEAAYREVRRQIEELELSEANRVTRDAAAAATSKANDLLLSFLDEGQKTSWKQKLSIDTATPSGNRYRLRGGWVVRLDEHGEETPEQYCLQPRQANLPQADKVLGRLLLLQANESLFLQKARRWGNAGCDAPVARTTTRPSQWNDNGRWLRDEWWDRPPYERREARLIRFTQRLDQIDEAHNWGLPPNVQAYPERNSIVWEGREYRIVNHTIEQEPFPYFAHGTRTVTLEVEPTDYPVPWHEWRLGR